MANINEPQDCFVDQPIFIAEIVLDQCENQFGQAPCTATGDPCYNTWATCKDPCNFIKDCNGKSFWFSSCEVPKQLQLYNVLPWVIESTITTIPTKALIGETFSTQGGGSFCVLDLPHTDQYFDPYWPRGAIPICPEDMPGTLMARWLRRVKIFEGRRINIYRGDCSMMDLCEFARETYVLEQPTGVSKDGRICFQYKDILSVTRNAVVPRGTPKLVSTTVGGPAQGLLPLGVDMDGVPTDSQPGADPYQSIGALALQGNYVRGDLDQDTCLMGIKHIQVDSEIVGVNPVSINAIPSGWNFNINERGACGSQIAPHKRGTQVKLCRTFPCGMHKAMVVCEILEETQVSDVFVLCCNDEPRQLINFDSFREYICCHPYDVLTEDVVICEPESAKKLLDELASEMLFLLYPKAGTIQMQSLKPPCDLGDVIEIEECMTVQNSFNIPDDIRGGASFTTVRYGVRDWSKSATSKDNFIAAQVYTLEDAFLKTCEKNGWLFNNPFEITSRWIGIRGEYQAQTAAERLLLFKSCPQPPAEFQVLKYVADCLEFGQYAILSQDEVQGTDGQSSADLWLINGIWPNELGTCYNISALRLPYTLDQFKQLTCDGECAFIFGSITDACDPDCVAVY